MSRPKLATDFAHLSVGVAFLLKNIIILWNKRQIMAQVVVSIICGNIMTPLDVNGF